MSELIGVESEGHGLSLLQFLKTKFSYSGKAIKRAIDANGCFINGRVERFSSSRVKEGDKIALKFEKGVKKTSSNFPILYQDETLIAVNKSPFAPCGAAHRLHRLDRDTSGVLLLSDDLSYHNLFRQRQIEKVYLAVVEGYPQEKKGVINFPIGIKKRYDGHKIMEVSEGGKEAITGYRVVKRQGKLTVLMLYPKTGRTHQIRVHLTASNLPILGDYDYCKSFSFNATRMLLHAYQVRFIHPHTKKRVVITAPIPEDMEPYIKEKELFLQV